MFGGVEDDQALTQLVEMLLLLAYEDLDGRVEGAKQTLRDSRDEAAEELKAQIRQHWLFRFDWFIKSRTPKELQRRIETLINLVEKEFEEIDKKRPGGGGGAPASKKPKA